MIIHSKVKEIMKSPPVEVSSNTQAGENAKEACVKHRRPFPQTVDSAVL